MDGPPWTVTKITSLFTFETFVEEREECGIFVTSAAFVPFNDFRTIKVNFIKLCTKTRQLNRN
jgi:hypothetical protein